jgi:hypothetical protein
MVDDGPWDLVVRRVQQPGHVRNRLLGSTYGPCLSMSEDERKAARTASLSRTSRRRIELDETGFEPREWQWHKTVALSADSSLIPALSVWSDSSRDPRPNPAQPLARVAAWDVPLRRCIGHASYRFALVPGLTLAGGSHHVVHSRGRFG